MKLKNIYLALVLLLGVSLTSFGQTTPPKLPEMPDLEILTSTLHLNDCSPIVEDYLEEYRDDYAKTYQARIKQTPKEATSFTLGENPVLIELQQWQGSIFTGSWVTIDQKEFIVDVKDDTDPTVSATNFMENLMIDEGECYATMPNIKGMDANLYFDDNSTSCDGTLQIKSQSPKAGTHVPVGTNITVEITAKDQSKNSAVAITTFSVIDNEGPVMTPIPDLRIANYLNECHAFMPDVSDHVRTNFVSDCSGQGVITQIPAIDEVLVHGSNPVIVTMADGAGNVTTQSFDMVVFDNEVPDISLKQYPAFALNDSKVRVYWNAIVNANDNCDDKLDGSIVKENGDSGKYVTFDCCELGENTVMVTVEDDDGNESTITATVLIYDTLAPNITYLEEDEITLGTTDTFDKCEAVIPDLRHLIEGNVEDNCDECSIANFTYVQKYRINGGEWLDWTLGTLIYHGNNNQVGLFVEDNVKNISKPAIVDLIIEDTTGPVLVLNDITLQLDEEGIARMKFTDVYNREESSDNCSFIVESDSYMKLEWHDKDYYYEFDCSEMGVSFPLELQVRDLSGNLSNVAITNITIEDHVSPILDTHDFTLNLDENGAGIVMPLDFVYHPLTHSWGVTDNCTASADIDLKIAEGTYKSYPDMNDSSLWFDDIDYDCTDISSHHIWVKATDESGNMTVRHAGLSVEDNMVPTIVGQDVVLQVDPDGLVNLNVMQIENGSTDNCGIELYTMTKVDGHPTNMPNPDMGVQNYMFSTCYGNGHDMEYYTQAMASFSKTNDDCCGGLGLHEVEYTVIDKYDNKSSMIVNVTILEHIIARAHVTIEIPIPSNGYLSAMAINDGSTDCFGDNIFSIYRVDNAVDGEPLNKERLTLRCDDFMFDEDGNPLGLNVMLKVQENHPDGEVAFAPCTVYFMDWTAPIAIAVDDFQVTLDENNLFALTPDDIDNGSSDNSGCITKTIYLESEGQVMESGEINFTEDHIGQVYNVILRVVDKFGNEDYTETVVTVAAGTGKVLSTEAMEVAKFTVYPNPTTRMLFVSNPNNTEMHVRLYNLTGKLVLEQNSFASKVKLNVSGIDDGLYLVQIMSNNQLIVSKRIIKK